MTQPAVSLQVRALEKRLGTQLLDRSGRRVEPTEAGRRLYRGAQRLLALEEQLVAEVGGEAEGELAGTLEIGASTGPGGIVLPLVLCGVPAAQPGGAHRALGLRHAARWSSGSPARARARRRRRGAAAPRRRLRAVLPRRGRARRARRAQLRRQDRCTLDELKRGAARVMQEGAGVRQVIEDELREVGVAAPRPRRPARARAAGVGRERGARRLRRHVHLAHRDRGATSPPARSRARVEGLEPSREIFLVRATGRAETRAAQAFVEFATRAARVIVRWGLD